MAGRVLVTGGTGFIGGHLVRTLTDHGREVRTCGRGPRPSSVPDPVDYHRVDLAADQPLDELLAGVDRVFHAAGASSSTADEEEMARTNVRGTARVLAAAHARDVGRVVHVSTSSVYGKEVPLPQPVSEDAQCHPSGGYAETKHLAEQVVERFVAEDLPVSVLRPVTVYGPGAVKLVASTILDAAIERYAGLDTFAVPAEPNELRLVHVDDVVEACLHLAEHPDAPGGVFNLASGAYPTSHELASAVCDGLGMQLELTEDPSPGLEFQRRGEVRERMLHDGMEGAIMLKQRRIRMLRKANPNNRLCLEAIADTGFSPQHTDVATGVAGSIRWYREHRWII